MDLGTVNRNVPGLVAALYDGRGEDAAVMVHDALTDTPAPILVREMWAYLTNGWLMLMEDTAGGVPTADAVSDYWTVLAAATVLHNDDQDRDTP